jgi:hypothetical protein
LHKLEPNELANTPADQILAALPEFSAHSIGQLQLFEKRTTYKARSASKARRQG